MPPPVLTLTEASPAPVTLSSPTSDIALAALFAVGALVVTRRRD